MTIGEQFKQMREAAELSQAGLAEESGVGRQHINAIETGRRVPSVGTIERLLGALDRATPWDCVSLTIWPVYQWGKGKRKGRAKAGKQSRRQKSG